MYQIENKTHTSDIRLLVKADSLEELFKGSLVGLNQEIAGEIIADSESEVFADTVEILSIDRTSLLVDFLSEMLALSQIHQLIFFDINFIHLEECRLKAEIFGMHLDDIVEEIKAVTYHEAEINFDEGLWSTILVFDI